MINWVVDQTLLISLFVLLFALGRPVLHKLLGATGYYSLWLLIPVCLLISGMSLPATVSMPLQQYVITAKQTTMSLSQQVESYHGTIALFWLSACVLLIIAVIHQHYRYFTSLNLIPLDDSELNNRIALTELKGVTDLTIYTSEHVRSPFVSGILRPSLILPHKFITDYSPLQRNLILRHESVHHQRKDLVWNGLAMLLTILFWFNPLSWYGLRLFRQSQEIACDQRVVANLSKPDRQAYANAMLTCAEYGEKTHLTVLNYGAKDLMKERLTTIKTHRSQRFGVSVSAIILVLCTFLGINLAGAKTENVAKPGHEYPLKRIEPKYPVEAAEQGIEGSVILQFDIKVDGSVSNVKVVEANPVGVFEHNAKAALAKWTYHPLHTAQTGMLVQLDFKLGPASQTKTDLAMTESRETIAVIK